MTIELNDTFFLPDAPQSTAPAFVTSFRTAAVAGIAWSGPRDHVRLPSRVAYSAPPAFARPAAAVPISGMAWDTLKETDSLPKGRFLTDPAAIVYTAPIVTWSFGVGDTLFLRDAPLDTAPGFARPLTQPVGTSGMAWQTPLDRNRPAVKVTFEAPAALALTPDTLPPKIAGMAWSVQVSERGLARPGFDQAPAFVRQASAPVGIAGMAWQVPQDAMAVRRVGPGEQRPGFVQLSLPVSGMAWFVPADQRQAGRPVVDQVAAFDPIAVPAVGVSGMAWQAPQDAAVASRRGLGDQRPGFLQQQQASASVPISGMAWFAPPYDLMPVRRNISSDPAIPLAIAAVAVTWSFSGFDPLPPRRALAEPRLGFVQPSAAAAVPVSGMAWFAPLDQVRPRVRVSVEAPASFGRAVAPPVGISGMAWFEPAIERIARRVPLDQVAPFIGVIGASPVVVYVSPRGVVVPAEARLVTPRSSRGI